MLITKAVLTLGLILLSQSRPAEGEKDHAVPQVLIDAIRHRATFKTAAFSLRYEREIPGIPTWVRNLEFRWADEILYKKDLGDDDGLTWPRDPDSGEHRLGMRDICSPEEMVFDQTSGTAWVRRLNNPLFHNVSSANHFSDFVDVRTFGIRAGEIPRKTPNDFVQVFREKQDVKYVVEPIGKSLFRVKLITKRREDGSQFEIAWEIDAEKGPEILSVSEYSVRPDGSREFLCEMRSALAQIDGRWWPIEIDCAGREGFRLRVRFSRVEFDRPEHPKKIDADFLGIPTGANVVVENEPSLHHYISHGQTVDHELWQSMKSNYDLGPLTEFFAKTRALGTCEFPAWWEAASDMYGVEGVADRPDLWETYVRRWVIKHTNNGAWRVVEPLTDGQKTAAQSILDDCRKRATPIRARQDHECATVKAELAAIEKMLAAPVTSAPATGAATSSGTVSPSVTTSKPASDTSESKSATPPTHKTQSNSNGSKKPDIDRAGLEAQAAVLREKAAALEKSPEIKRLFDELKHRLDGVRSSKQADPAAGKIVRPTPPPFVLKTTPTSRPAIPASQPAAFGR